MDLMTSGPGHHKGRKVRLGEWKRKNTHFTYMHIHNLFSFPRDVLMYFIPKRDEQMLAHPYVDAKALYSGTASNLITCLTETAD